MKGKCIRCFELGHRWRECAAYAPPVVGTNGHNSSENACCLASVLLETSVSLCKEGPSKKTADKWVADSGATYNITRSADMMHGMRPTNDKVGIGDSRTIDIVGYGTLTVVFPGNLTVKLLDVAYVPDRSCNLFSLMAAHRRSLGFRTEKSGMCISLFDGRLRFEGDGSRFSGFGWRIEPDDDCCIPPPDVPPNVTHTPREVTLFSPVNHVDVDCDFPQTFLVMAPDTDGSSKTAADVVRVFSAHVLAADSPPRVEILSPNSGGRFCGGEFG